jgi:hypothetical protein
MKIFVLIFLALVGCASAPQMSEKASHIQVHRQVSTLLVNCKKLGPVTANAIGWHFSPTYAADSAIIKGREQTADMGGDSMVVLNMDNSGDVLTIQASALRCHTP